MRYFRKGFSKKENNVAMCPCNSRIFFFLNLNIAWKIDLGNLVGVIDIRVNYYHLSYFKVYPVNKYDTN